MDETHIFPWAESDDLLSILHEWRMSRTVREGLSRLDWQIESRTWLFGITIHRLQCAGGGQPTYSLRPVTPGEEEETYALLDWRMIQSCFEASGTWIDAEYRSGLGRAIAHSAAPLTDYDYGDRFCAAAVFAFDQVAAAIERGVAISYLRELFHCLFGAAHGHRECAACWEIDCRSDAMVRAIAHSIYESEDFSAMPVLHDALLELGCHPAPLVRHCKVGNHHMRGCWVLGLLLAKELRSGWWA
jgi:hypothetical protein